MALKLPTTRRGIVLVALLTVAVPLASFYAGMLTGIGRADGPVVSSAHAVAMAPPPDVADIYATDNSVAVESDPAGVADSGADPGAEADAEAEIEPVVRAVAVESGDNLMSILVRAGVDRSEAHAAIAALEGVYNPRRDLSVGDTLQLTLWPAGAADDKLRAGSRADSRAGGNPGDVPEDTPLALDNLLLPVAFDRDVAVKRGDDGGFSAAEIERPLERHQLRAEGTIGSSLFVDGRDAGLPIGVLIELIRIYSFDVDFQREIQPGDRFEVMYEQFRDDDGKPVHNGEIAYARLTLSGTELPLYRYETTAGNLDWFNAKGESVRKALMRTPIDGARLSSGFGMRKHPILGYSRLHAGTDFAAPSGTPIYAAGSGTIQEIGVKGGYGKYIRLRHNSNYDTAYAHMKGYARGMTRGKRVNQGQIIGYVGTTGRSTGPHLHYEVHRDGAKINPLALKLPSGEKLKGKELDRFVALRKEVDRSYAALTPTTLIAGNESDTVSCGGGTAGKKTDGGC
jgi:murein DD-endopeptidase MepM/ murein hydrolase activator NlpD